MAQQDMAALVDELRQTFRRGVTLPLAWRQRQLANLSALLEDHEREIFDALRQDLGRAETESYFLESGFCQSELRYTRRRLEGWMKPDKVTPPLLLQPGRAAVHHDPKGVVLIIGPWNLPVMLVLAPLINALAAGNCAVLKPSELAPASSALLARLIPQYLDPACVRVVEGGVAETTALLAQRFDHIFYTGNGTVGRIVMTAAAQHLTPVTLELGGRNPCYVDRQADLGVAARRIVWTKFMNAGQVCVAPDHLLVHEQVHDALLPLLRQAIREFYGDDPRRSSSYARIINARHHQRLTALLDGGRIYCGGEHELAERYLAPTVLTELAEDAAVLQDEIFGPILPVLRVRGLDEVLQRQQGLPQPLAAYAFTTDDEVARSFTQRVSAGAVSINQCVFHVGFLTAPFGGVGASGMGGYHGRFGFETFSHAKTVLQMPATLDVQKIGFPPYGRTQLALIKRLL